MENRNRPLSKSTIKHTPKYNKLKNFIWGLGIEHEVHYFHQPPLIKDKPIKDIIVFDSFDQAEKIVQLHYKKKTNKLEKQLLDDYRLSPLDLNFIKNIPFEQSGRLCQKQWVLKKINFKMPEIITSNPFSTLKNKKSIEDYCKEIINKEFVYIGSMAHYDQLNHDKIKNYGPVKPYPFGMSSYIKEPIGFKNNSYVLKKSNTTDYLGSYHLTITLPYDKNTTEKQFIKMHQNFANQLQWLEPLLLTSFFSCDDKSVGTLQKRIRGSFRVMRVGWGNLAGSDIRKFNKGIGRYSDIKTFWRNGLDFYDLDKLKWCSSVTIQEPGAISALSSNFRTFGSTDPDNPEERKSGEPMNIPNGIEFRIFDHFPALYLKELSKFIIYVAENSRVHTTKAYVYQNKNWINALHSIMQNGWKAILPKEYINNLRTHLDIPIKTKSLRAFDVLSQINTELFNKNNKGDWTYMILNDTNSIPVLPRINQRSWEFALLLYFNNHPDIIDKFNLLIMSIKQYRSFSIEEYNDMFFQAFPKSWSNNNIDILYLLESIDFVIIDLNDIGEIIKFTVITDNIKEFDTNDINNLIITEFLREDINIVKERILELPNEFSNLPNFNK